MTPQRLLRIPEPFDHPEFVYEIKVDGFRVLAHISRGQCGLVSRNGYPFKSWPALAEEIASAVRCRSALLDGEICCLRPDGRSDFNNLLFRREQPFLHAFDVLTIGGHDLRGLPLLERKRRLLAIVATVPSRLLYLDHLPTRGREFFEACRERDLEGIVAKRANGTYQSDGRATSWLKIKNPDYSQMERRSELFDSRREQSTIRVKLPKPALRLA